MRAGCPPVLTPAGCRAHGSPASKTSGRRRRTAPPARCGGAPAYFGAMLRLVLIAAVAAATVVPPSAAAAPLAFEPPRYIDPSYPGGEPVLFTDTIHHTLVLSSHEGTTHIYRPGLPASHTFEYATQYRNQVKMWVSTDHGLSFRRVNYLGTGLVQNPSQNTGFSDPDFTQDAGGRIYNTGIDLANQAVFSSPDGGYTWDAGTVQCSPGDRPWLAGGKKDEVFMATNTLIQDPSHRIFQSTDAGNTCSTDSIPGGTDTSRGHGKIYYDRATDQLVEPATGDDGGMGINVWKRGEEAFTYRQGTSGTTLYGSWPAIAIDGGGTTYVVWDTDARADGTSGGCGGNESPAPNEILMMYTKDFGRTWSPVITVARPDNARVLWPWIVAGDAGKVAVTWYQTDKVVDLACEKAAITVMSQHRFDASTEKPTVETANASGRPISINDICQSGTTCVATGEDRRLGDFFTNIIDERGCELIATGDTMSKDPLTGGERATSLPVVIRQNAGRRLIGAGDCADVPGAPLAGGAGAGAAPTLTPAPALPSNRRCTSRRRFKIHIRNPRGQRVVSARVYVNGKRTRVLSRHGSLHAVVDLRRLRRGRYTVKIVALTSQGRQVVGKRRYRTCVPKKRG